MNTITSILEINWKNWEEHNFKWLLNLIRSSGLEIVTCWMNNPDNNAIYRVTPDFIPSIYTSITINASSVKVAEILLASKEFSKYCHNVR